MALGGLQAFVTPEHNQKLIQCSTCSSLSLNRRRWDFGNKDHEQQRLHSAERGGRSSSMLVVIDSVIALQEQE